MQELLPKYFQLILNLLPECSGIFQSCAVQVWKVKNGADEPPQLRCPVE